MNTDNYTIPELLHDASFRRTVQGTASPEEINRWSHWIEASNQNRSKARKAATEIAGFDFITPELPDVEKEWNRLYRDAAGKQVQKTNTENSNRNRNVSLQWGYRIAAVLILGLMVGVGSYIYSNSGQKGPRVEQVTEERTIRTGLGERKTLKFSNGSKIVLNSNSSASYSLEQLHNQTINVVLDGEAYFDAEGNIAQEAPVFAVHTPDGVIRDIGTEFLVRVAKGQSSVVLQDGEVEVSTSGQDNEHSKFSVQKGEMLTFREATILTRKVVNPTFYTSWATNYMEFDKTAIKEVAAVIEQRFGVDVKITNSNLSGVTLDGAVYFRSLSELMQSVSKVANVPVYQSKNRKTIYIGHK